MKAIEGAQRAVSRINRLLCASDCEEGGRRPAGRAGGCAEAPRAGLPPYGLPSLTRNSRSRRTRQLPSQRKLRRIRGGPFAEQTSGGQIHFRSRQVDGGCSRCQSNQNCIHSTKDVRPGSPCFSVMADPALEWAFLGSVAAFHDQPARGSLRKRATSSASPTR